MNIVVAQRIFHPNTLGWVTGFQERGHRVCMIVNRITVETPVHACEIHVVENVRWIESLTRRVLPGGSRVVIPRPLQLWRVVRTLDPDMVLLKCQGQHVINQGPHVLFVSIFAALLRAKRVSWGNRAEGRSRWERFLAATGVMPRRHVRTVPTGVDDLSHVGQGREPLVPYAVVPADPTQRHARRNAVEAGDPIRVLTVGSFRSMRKRVWWTLLAADHAKLLESSAHFTFVGVSGAAAPGLDQVTALIADYDCADVVTIRPDVPFSEMPDVYALHDVLVLPGVREPFGMVVLEAMAHHLPVIVSDGVGALPFIADGVDGIVFGADDLPGLAAALRTMVSDPNKLVAMGESANSAVRVFASPDSCAAALEHVAFNTRTRESHARVT